MQARIGGRHRRLATLRAAVASQQADLPAARAEAAELSTLVGAARVEFSALEDEDAAVAR